MNEIQFQSFVDEMEKIAFGGRLLRGLVGAGKQAIKKPVSSTAKTVITKAPSRNVTFSRAQLAAMSPEEVRSVAKRLTPKKAPPALPSGSPIAAQATKSKTPAAYLSSQQLRQGQHQLGTQILSTPGQYDPVFWKHVMERDMAMGKMRPALRAGGITKLMSFKNMG